MFTIYSLTDSEWLKLIPAVLKETENFFKLQSDLLGKYWVAWSDSAVILSQSWKLCRKISQASILARTSQLENIIKCLSPLWEDKSLSGSITNFIFLPASLSLQRAKALLHLPWNIRCILPLITAAGTGFGCGCIFSLLFIFINLDWLESRGSVYRLGLPDWSCSIRFQVPLSCPLPPLAVSLYSSIAVKRKQPSATCVLSPACSEWAVWTHWQIWLEANFWCN